VRTRNDFSRVTGKGKENGCRQKARYQPFKDVELDCWRIGRDQRKGLRKIILVLKEGGRGYKAGGN